MQAPTEKVQDISPLQVRQLLAGLENGPVDAIVLNYLHGLLAKVQIKYATFIHALPPRDFFSVNEFVNTFQEDLDKEENGTREQLKTAVERAFDGLEAQFSIWVGEGNPLEVVLNNAEELNADLVVIGQKTSSKSHGIKARNFARYVKCNALVIPDKAIYRMNKILVPVDFSDNSGKGLRTAVALAKYFTPSPEIEVLHLFELPPNIGAYRFSESKLIQLIEEDRKEALPEFVNKYVPEKDQTNLKLTVLQSVRWPIGHHIAQFAQENGHDLIVNGAKGHSRLGLMLLGSVTEKLLANTQQVPVLIVK